MKQLPSPAAAILLAVTLALPSACRTPKSVAGAHPPLPTVKHVDLKRYAGNWHEVARLPNPFQKNCLKSTANYRLLPDGTVEVVNMCAKKGGGMTDVKGAAEPVTGTGNARLKVRFRGLAALAPVPKEGNYWIIALDDDYQWAMVGTPDRKNLWMLARQPHLPFDTYTALKTKAQGLGFDVSKLIPEAQTPPELKQVRRRAGQS